MSWERTQRSMLAGIVGPGVGEIYYLVAARGQTDHYYWLLKKRGVRDSKIFTSLSAGYDQMQDEQNDCLLVYPGNHVQTASLTWDKDSTFIVGAGSINQRFQPTTLTEGGVRLTCTTAAVAEILSITGDYVSMYGIGTHNTAADTGNKADIKISGKNFFADYCAFRGGTNATQVQNATAGIPVWVASTSNGAGNALWIRNSMIGSAGNTTRTKGPGCLYFEGGGGGFNPVIENCLLSTRCEVQTGNQSCMVLLEAAYAIDRELLFKGTNFYCFVENLANRLDVAITDECTTTHTITITPGCSFSGIDAVATPMTYVQNAASVGHATGGFGLNS